MSQFRSEIMGVQGSEGSFSGDEYSNAGKPELSKDRKKHIPYKWNPSGTEKYDEDHRYDHSRGGL